MLPKSAFLAALALVASVASAGTIQLTVDGLVGSSNISSIAVGQQFTVTVTYDSTTLPQLIANHQAFFADAMQSIAIDVGSYHTSYSAGVFGQINQYDNLSNFDGISFQAATNPATYQFSSAHGVSLAPIQQGQILSPFDNIIINLATNSNALWSGYGLPTSYNFADFDQTRNFLVAFQDGGFSGGFTNLVASDITGAPEPGTWLLAGASLLGLLGSRLKRG